MFFSRWHRVAPMVLVGAFALCADGAVAQEQDDDAEAVRLYRQAAEQGNADAQFNLGVMYLDGDGVPQDDAEAMRWFRQAAEQGNAQAQTNLGVPQDDAMYLGNMYVSGRASRRTTPKAVRLFRQAAEQGRRTTPKPCGGSAKPPSKATPKHSSTSGSEGRGVPQDDAEAVRLCLCQGRGFCARAHVVQAAEQGDAQAQFNLGVSYAYARGADFVLALTWFNIADTNGHEGAREARDAIERKMTRDEVTRATELARACLASDYRNCEP